MKLKNKIAVVTGASTGIGRAIAIEFGKHGVKVLITARRKEELEKTKKLIKTKGAQAEVIVADLKSIDSVNNLIKTIKRKAKKIDILINVAGVWHGKNESFSGKDYQTFKQETITLTLSVGTWAPMILSHGLIPLMPKNGKILNISGTFENGAKGWLPYYVSKKAIEDLTVGLSEELEEKKIQVNCISPSDTATKEYKKYFPQYIKEAISPVEIAKYAAFLCSKEANRITGKIFVMKKGKKPFESFHF